MRSSGTTVAASIKYSLVVMASTAPTWFGLVHGVTQVDSYYYRIQVKHDLENNRLENGSLATH